MKCCFLDHCREDDIEVISLHTSRALQDLLQATNFIQNPSNTYSSLESSVLHFGVKGQHLKCNWGISMYLRKSCCHTRKRNIAPCTFLKSKPRRGKRKKFDYIFCFLKTRTKEYLLHLNKHNQKSSVVLQRKSHDSTCFSNRQSRNKLLSVKQEGRGKGFPTSFLKRTTKKMFKMPTGNGNEKTNHKKKIFV